MKEILKLSWSKFFIIILLVGIGVYSVLMASGCGLAMDSSLGCMLYINISASLAFLLVTIDFEKNLILVIILEIAYLYSLASLIQGIYLVMKKKIPIKNLISILIILVLVWGGCFSFLTNKDKKGQNNKIETMRFAKGLKTKKECEDNGFIWNVQNDCIVGDNWK